AHAAVFQAGALQPVARKEKHVERKIEAETALDLAAEQFEHPSGAGAEIEQGPEWLIGKRGTDRIFDRFVGHMQLAYTVPLHGVGAEICLSGGSPRLPDR